MNGRAHGSTAHRIGVSALAIAVTTLVFTSALLLLLPGSLRDPSGLLGEPTPLQPATASEASISDGQTVTVSSPVSSFLNDSVSYGSGTGGHRWYWVNLTVSVALLNVSVALTTFPITQWGLPQQLPGGADSLPSLAFWNWTVLRAGANDTSQWTATSWDQRLNRATNWTNQSYEIIGTSEPRVTVLIDPALTGGTTTPGTGFVVNTPGLGGGIPTNDSSFLPTAAALDPTFVRFSTRR